MRTREILRFILSIGVSLVAGAIGSIFTASAIPSWYATLVRPDFAPPNWLFGPVWTLLYILMGIALYLVWSAYTKTSGNKKKRIKTALVVFGIQLVLNALWSLLFFGLRNPTLGFVEIIFLWLSILVSIILFARISKVAAWLLVPYILWVSFASYLNYSIMILN